MRSVSPSLSHQASMLRPKTPLFSFITCRLFHQGIVASGIRARLPISFGMLRPSPFEASASPYMISRPPWRSER